MEKIISTARLKSDPRCRQIIESLEARQGELGLTAAVLYYDFPMFRDYEHTLFRPSLLILSPRHGVITVRVSDSAVHLKEDDEDLTQFHSLLYSKFLGSKRLRRSRNDLLLPMTSVLFLPPGANEHALAESENLIISSIGGLEDVISAETCDQSVGADTIQEARSIIEGVKALTKARSRAIPEGEPKSKALVLRKLEDEIANFDAHQRRAALTVTLGPQRIRGLAGSGKTIVLAWKAAHLHLTDPDKKILFTFYTKSLYGFIRRQITRFYRHFRDADPNWDNLHVLHAWGGRSEPGVYYNTCLDHEIVPKTWGSVSNRQSPFDYVCRDLASKVQIKPKYDFFLIDEAQDFPSGFFELAFQLTHGARDEKSIIWAYDELQSIFEPKVRSARDLFGIDTDGEPRIDLDRAAAKMGLPEFIPNDLILYKCYRNPLDVLVSAHALGLGIYGPEIVQMLQDRDHWEAVGYVVEKGNFTIGSPTVLVRPAENSPLSILEVEERKNIVQVHLANNLVEEVNWAVDLVKTFIADGLTPEDILVISADDRNAKDYFAAMGQSLAEQGISVHDVLSSPFSRTYFSVEGHVTLSTVHRAKGNEAAAVILLGIDALWPERNLRRGRNKLFTAFTRAKAWLRVGGCKNGAEGWSAEIDQALHNSPRLVFDWPDLKKVETIQRDLSKREERARKAKEKYLREMAELGISEEEALADLITEKRK
jgi:superfamily I DNA and RNA helicase